MSAKLFLTEPKGRPNAWNQDRACWRSSPTATGIQARSIFNNLMVESRHEFGKLISKVNGKAEPAPDNYIVVATRLAKESLANSRLNRALSAYAWKKTLLLAASKLALAPSTSDTDIHKQFKAHPSVTLTTSHL